MLCVAASAWVAEGWIVRRKPVSRQYETFGGDDFRTVLEGFRVGSFRSAHTLVVEGDRLILLNEKSETSRKFVVETENGNRYFLKEVPWYCDDDAHIAFVVSIAADTVTAGLPVPTPVLTIGAQPAVTHQGSKFTLSEYRPGYLWTGAPAQIEAAATWLARFHQFGRSRLRDAAGAQTTTRDVLQQHHSLAEDRWPGYGESDVGRTVLELVGRLPLTEAGHLAHGDFIPWNIAFEVDGGIASVFDFDNAGYGSRLRDVGKALSSFFLLPYAGPSAILHPYAGTPAMDEEAMGWFVQSYSSVDELTREEQMLMPLYVAAGFMASILLSFVRGDQRMANLDRAARSIPEILDATASVMAVRSRA